jgi:hypothetical protein
MFGTEDRVGEDAPIDHAAKALASGSSRRTVMRGLAAGLLAAAGGGIATGALAKKKRKQKGKKNPQNQPQPTPTPNPRPQSACDERTSIAYLAVPSDGSIVETPVLKKGQMYHLRAEGWWGDGGEYATDAYARFNFGRPSEHTLHHGGVRVGLSVNDTSPDLWGTTLDSYTQTHRYTGAIVGKDAPATLKMIDSDYSNNHRDIYVEVICIPI